MKTHTSSFKEQIKIIGKEIDSRITFGSTVLGKNDLNAVTPSYQGAILKSVMKQLDIDCNVAIPIGTILKYEFGLKVNGEYEYINYGNYVVYSIEKQEDMKSYKITCYDKLLYSMLDYVKLPITYPISIRDYINSLSTALGLKFANKSGTFANYDKQIQADLYDGLGYTFRDILDELAQVTASTICLNNNDELEIRYITETGDTIDEEFLKDVNVNFGEKFGAVNTIVLSRSGDSDSVYYPSTLPTNPYEIKISDNQIMNGNDRAGFLPDIYNKLNGLEFYTNNFVSTGICYYDLCDRYSVKVGDNTYSCVMLNDEVLVTQGLEENIYTELPEQTETDYKHASKDDRMINQVYIIAKKNEAEILALVSTTETIQKEINPTKEETGSKIYIEDASENPLINLEIEGKSIQETRDGKNKLNNIATSQTLNELDITVNEDKSILVNGTSTSQTGIALTELMDNIYGGMYLKGSPSGSTSQSYCLMASYYDENDVWQQQQYDIREGLLIKSDYPKIRISLLIRSGITVDNQLFKPMIVEDVNAEYEPYGVMPSPDYPSEIESVGTYNEETGKYEIKVETVGKNLLNYGTQTFTNYYQQRNLNIPAGMYTFSAKITSEDTESVYSRVYFYDSSDNSLGSITLNRNVRASGKVTLTGTAVRVTILASTNYTNSKDKIATWEDIQLEEGIVATNYVPYQKRTTVIVLNEPLRSLPNGVKDIAYIRNNKLYVDRHISSVVLNGSENWKIANSGTNNYYYYLSIGLGIMISGSFISTHYIKTSIDNSSTSEGMGTTTGQIRIRYGKEMTLDNFKTWLSTHNTQVDYELATSVTEEYSEIEMLKTLKGYNNISTTDKLLPIINLTYVRDTIISDYVENHVTELKLTENEIKASVESVSSSVDGLSTTINRVEEITTDNSQVINVISTSSSFDLTTGEVREVTTTTGFTFNADGMTIDDGSGFKAEHTADGTYYKDGNSIVGQYTKDGSKQKDLELFGIYSYGKESIDDTPMFVGQLYTDENGEKGFGHFYNGEE